MKHIKLLFLLLFVSGLGFGQTILSVGDIVINGVISNNSDEFSFVLLRDVENGTQINFADKGWFASGSFRNNEGIVTWTADSYLTCGTEVTIVETALGSNTYNVNHGTAIETDTGFALAAAGDQIIAFQGTQASPTIIYAIFFASNVGWTDATTNNTSALPTGLTDGVNAIYIGNFNNGNYDCSVTSDSALILAAVSNNANWTTSDNRNLITVGGCSYSCISCPNTVTWNGTSWDNVTGPLSNDAVSLTGSYSTFTNGSFSACSLTVNPGFSLTIAEDDYVVIFTDVTNNGRILIQDKGSFVQVDNAAVYDDTGSSFFVTNNTSQVTRSTATINNWYEYTYWSSPVSNETVEDVLFTANPDRRFTFNAANFADLTYEFDNDNAATTYTTGDILDDIDDNGDDWQPASGLMIQGVGYAASMSPASISFGGPNFDHIFEGTLNNGDIDVVVVRNDNSNSTSAVPDNNWNFIGNPYPSAIDVDLFFLTNQWSTSNTTATLDGSIYLWSQNTPPSDTSNGNENVNFSGADYAVINGMGENAGGDGIIPTRHISSAQGFFVNFVDTAIRALPTGTVTFSNSMRVRDNNTQFLRTNNESVDSGIEKFRLNLTSDNGVFSQVFIGYNATATNNFDGSYYDAVKNLSSNNSVKFGSIINNNPNIYAIQGRSINSLNQNEVVPLAFSTSIDVATIYNISLASIEGNFLTNNTIYLKDNLTATIHDLSASNYSFTSEVGVFNDRFEVVFNNASLSTNDFVLNKNNLSIIELQNDNVLFKTGSELTIKSIQIFDVLGRNFYTFKGNSNTETFNLAKLSQAAYVAQVELSNGQTISKKAIKK